MTSVRTKKDQGNDLENLVYQKLLQFDKSTTLTSNSGARFSDGDIATQIFRIECKSTSQKSFSLKLGDWKKIQRIADTYSKIGIVVERNGEGLVVAHIAFEELMYIIELVSKEIYKLREER